MKVKVPEYYKEFRCIGGECSDNCCIGWEIDIDDVTLEKYGRVGGALGERLKSSIKEDGGVSHFVLNGERCPFLNEKNLCDIITELGEGHLCDICNLHPRYFSSFTDFAIGGVGMCCEEAARLILTEKGKHTYCDIDMKQIDPDGCDGEVLKLLVAEKQTFVDILEDNSMVIAEKLASLLERAFKLQARIDGDDGEFSPEVCEASLLEYFSTLEHINGKLGELLARCDGVSAKLDEEGERYVSRTCIYYLDRYLYEAARDFDAVGKVAFAVLSAEVLALTLSKEGCGLDNAIRLAKCYSKEIEYSEDNIYRMTGECEVCSLAISLLKSM